MFLPAAAMDMHAGRTIEQFDGKQIDGLARVERGDIARIVDAQAIRARGGDDNFVNHRCLRVG